MARVTLRYTASAGLKSPAVFAAQFAAAELLDGELEQLGMIVVSDDTIEIPNRMVMRTIVLETTAQGDSQWTTDEELKAATRNLYTGELDLRVPALVRAAEPEVSH